MTDNTAAPAEDTAPAVEAPAAEAAPVEAAAEAAPAADPAPAVDAAPVHASWKAELADLLRRAAGAHILAGNPLDSAKILNDLADLLSA